MLVGLHVNPVRTVIEVEVVHVRRAHINAERVGDLRKRDVKAFGLFAIDGDEKLRIAGAVRGEQASEIFFLALVSLPDEFVRDLV